MTGGEITFSQLIFSDVKNDGMVNDGDKLVVDLNESKTEDKGDEVLIIGEHDKRIKSLLYIDKSVALKNSGIKVKILNQYLYDLKDAKKCAKEGCNIDFYEAGFPISISNKFAKEAGIKIDNRRLSKLEKKWYSEWVEIRLAHSEDHVKEDRPEDTERSILITKKYANKARVKINKARLNKIKKGINIKWVEVMLGEAEEHAETGEYIFMEKCILSAKKYAKKAGIKIDQVRLSSIEKEGYTKGIEVELAKAEENAKEGYLMEEYITNAKRCADKVGIEINKTRVDRIYTKVIEHELDEAEKYAKKGDLYDHLYIMETCISKAKDYAKKGGVKIDQAKLSSIYTKVVEVELDKSKELAKEGNVYYMERHIVIAKEYTDKAGIKIDQAKLSSIEKEGYTKGVEAELAQAEMWADGGIVDVMEERILNAKRYANKVGIKIDQARINKIKKVGYTMGVDIELVLAEESAEEGNAGSMKKHISNAKMCTKYVGIKTGPGSEFSKRVRKIRTIYKKLGKSN